MSTSHHDEKMYWLALHQLSIFGPSSWKKILESVGTIKEFWHLPASRIRQLGLRPKAVEQFINQRDTAQVKDCTAILENTDIKIVTALDPEYPETLRHIHAYPPILYYRGHLPNQSRPRIAVVGTRKLSRYGQQVTQDIVADLVAQKITTVSGLALGIDTIAHQTTINNKGITIAVLGSGLSDIYPSSNQKLAEKIVEAGGCVLSEFPPHTPPYKSNFPQRNRIIAGLSSGVIIPEAGEDSGALITARYAIEQNRDVFAVPGAIHHPGAHGPISLLKQGAYVATSAADVLEKLNLPQQPVSTISLPPMETLTTLEIKIITILNNETTHIDELVQQLDMPITSLNATLAVMEIKGLIQNYGNQSYGCAQPSRRNQ